MKCFNCSNRKMKTIYPPGFVQKKCMICGHKTTAIKIPEKINTFIEPNIIDWGVIMDLKNSFNKGINISQRTQKDEAVK